MKHILRSKDPADQFHTSRLDAIIPLLNPGVAHGALNHAENPTSRIRVIPSSWQPPNAAYARKADISMPALQHTLYLRYASPAVPTQLHGQSRLPLQLESVMTPYLPPTCAAGMQHIKFTTLHASGRLFFLGRKPL